MYRSIGEGLSRPGPVVTARARAEAWAISHVGHVGPSLTNDDLHAMETADRHVAVYLPRPWGSDDTEVVLRGLGEEEPPAGFGRYRASRGGRPAGVVPSGVGRGGVSR